MKTNKKENFLTLEETAAKLKVLPSDVLNWINEGKLKAIKQKNGKYFISPEEYQNFLQSFPKELLDKIGEYLWKSVKTITPSLQKEVAARFKRNSQFVLDRDEEAVRLMETLHRKYEPKIDVFNDKRGAVASFIIYARVISILYSIIKLLRSGVPSESFILFRPLWEAVLLAEYFLFSDANNDNQNKIRKWFEEDKSPYASDVRDYLSERLNMPIDLMRKLHNMYSKPVHHTYRTIMETYRAISMSGPCGERTRRLGFDYHQSSIMRDIVDLISGFETLLQCALQGYYMCFSKGIPLTAEESLSIKAEIEFYDLDTLKRLDIIFKRENTQNKGLYTTFRFFLKKSYRFLLTRINSILHS